MRFLLGGMATVAGLVMLFVASFGEPTQMPQQLYTAVSAIFQSHSSGTTPEQTAPPVTNPAHPQTAPSAAPPPAQSSDEAAAEQKELEQLKQEAEQETQQVASLHDQASSDRHTLDTLQQQRAAEQTQVKQLQAARDHAAAQAAQTAKTSQQEVAQTPSPEARKAVADAAAQQAAADAAAQKAEAQAAALRQQREALTQQLQQLHAEMAQASQSVESLHSQAAEERHAVDALQQQQAAEQAKVAQLKADQQRAAEAAAKAAQALAEQQARQKAELAAAAATPPPTVPAPEASEAPRPVRTAHRQKPNAAEMAADSGAIESVLNRLRHKGHSAPPAAPAQVAEASPPRDDTPSPPPHAEPSYAQPPQVSPRERLGMARAALVAGRLGEAQQYLEEAQLQLVFRPVTPTGDDSSGGSRAASEVAQALSMLGAGDSNGALQQVDRAMAESGGSGSPPPPQTYGYSTYGGNGAQFSGYGNSNGGTPQAAYGQ